MKYVKVIYVHEIRVLTQKPHTAFKFQTIQIVESDERTFQCQNIER